MNAFAQPERNRDIKTLFCIITAWSNYDITDLCKARTIQQLRGQEEGGRKSPHLSTQGGRGKSPLNVQKLVSKKISLHIYIEGQKKWRPSQSMKIREGTAG